MIETKARLVVRVVNGVVFHFTDETNVKNRKYAQHIMN